MNMNMTIITEEVLNKLNACEEGKNWWLRNVGEGFPVSRIKDIKGDFNKYISWLKDRFYNNTYDEKGNVIGTKCSTGYWTEMTYNENGNRLSYKNSNGDWEICVYDDRGNQIHVKNSDDEWEEYVYDKNGNLLSSKYSVGALIIHIVIKAVLWLALIGLITLIGAVVISAVLLKGVAK